MTPVSCVYEPHSSNAIFKIQIKKVSKRVIIATADPFFFRKIDKGNKNCKQIYKGPNLVLLNLTSHEYCPLDQPVEQLTIQDFHYCFEEKNFQGLAWWNELDCGNPAYEEIKYFFQVKIFGNNRFVYCPKQKIAMKNLTFECPDFVFSLPIDIEFRIGRIEFQSIEYDLRGNIDFSSREIHALNLRLFNHVANDMDPFNPVSWSEESSNSYYSIILKFLLPVVLVFILCSVLLYLRKTKSSRRFSGRETVKEELIELKQQSTSTSTDQKPVTHSENPTHTTVIYA